MEEELREIVENPIINYMIKDAIFTKKQLFTYLIWQKYKEYNIKLHKKIKVYNKYISLGTFYRILSQFRENVYKSLVNVLLLLLLDIMSKRDLDALMEIASLIKTENMVIDEEMISHVLNKLKKNVIKTKK